MTRRSAPGGVGTLMFTACRLLDQDQVPEGAADPPGDTRSEVAEVEIEAVIPVEGRDPVSPPRLVTVGTVLDGDTFWAVPDDGGGSVEVRVIGVDTPEIAHLEPAECFGDEAWAFTRETLTGRRVWLGFDADGIDAYGRTLAYVTTTSGERGFYNRELLRQGFAETLTIAPNDTWASIFRTDEQAARDADVGRWAACGP